MPNTKSARKEARKNLRRRKANRERNEALKTLIKRYRRLVAQKKFGEAQASLPGVQQALDKAVKTNLLKKNTASRLKSRLAHAMARASKASS